MTAIEKETLVAGISLLLICAVVSICSWVFGR